MSVPGIISYLFLFAGAIALAAGLMFTFKAIKFI